MHKEEVLEADQLLTEVLVVSVHIQKKLLTDHDVEKDILVFDGGDSDNPPITPHNVVNWRRISILRRNLLWHLIIMTQIVA